jgi:RNA polymerase sigma factor (sigma-70 family)
VDLETEESVLDVLDDVESESRDVQFAAWISPHLSALSAVAAQHLGRNDAADVVQETLIRAWRRWSTYSEARGSARAWLMAILADQIRRYRTRHLSRWRSADSVTVEPSPAADLGRRLDLEDAVRLLPARQQEVVALYYLADLSVDEVAEVLGISAGSVKSHLSAARSRLRDVLEEK